LWKPLIDAFGSVLGEVLLRAFQPNHDRIVRLGLQHHVTSGIGRTRSWPTGNGPD
jgi:hypothetical protein